MFWKSRSNFPPWSGNPKRYSSLPKHHHKKLSHASACVKSRNNAMKLQQNRPRFDFLKLTAVHFLQIKSATTWHIPKKNTTNSILERSLPLFVKSRSNFPPWSGNPKDTLPSPGHQHKKLSHASASVRSRNNKTAPNRNHILIFKNWPGFGAPFRNQTHSQEAPKNFRSVACLNKLTGLPLFTHCQK